MKKVLKIFGGVALASAIIVAIKWDYVSYLWNLTAQSATTLISAEEESSSEELMNEIKNMSIDKLLKIDELRKIGNEIDDEEDPVPDEEIPGFDIPEISEEPDEEPIPSEEIPGGDEEEENNYPIIVIPGVMGSKLFSDRSCTKCVWSPAENPLALKGLGEKLSMDKTLFVKPCKDQNKLKKSRREYGAISEYEELVDSLCEAFPKRKVYFFSYDFRYSNVDSAQKLSAFIDTLGDTKVDLVCHSMGGLVASQYVSSSQTHKEQIDKIITLGTPYEGSPKVMLAVLNNVIVSKGDNSLKDFGAHVVDKFLGLCGLNRDVFSKFIGVGELTPNSRYFDYSGFYIDKNAGLKSFRPKDYERISYENYKEICGSMYGTEPYQQIVNAQDNIVSGDISILASMPNTYFGVGTDVRTVKSIVFGKSKDSNDEEQRATASVQDLIFEASGDGTVPYDSATMCRKLGKKVENGHFREFPNTNHGELDSNDASINWVIDILEGEEDTTGGGDSLEKEDEKEDNSYMVVRVACPVEAKITKDGETLSSDPKDDKDTASFGEVYRVGENNEIKIIVMDKNDDYDISLDAFDEGTMDYEIRYFNGENELEHKVTFTEVELEETTVIKTDSNEKQEIKLQVDKDSDGVVDYAIKPDKKVLKKGVIIKVIIFSGIGILLDVCVILFVIRRSKLNDMME